MDPNDPNQAHADELRRQAEEEAAEAERRRQEELAQAESEERQKKDEINRKYDQGA